MVHGVALHWAGKPHGKPCKTGRNMWGVNDELRPSKRLNDLLTGAVSPQDAHANILPWAEFMIWQAATKICGMRSLELRRNALTKVPDTIKPFVEREMKRMWNARKKL
jgi:hypothetical protein